MSILKQTERSTLFLIIVAIVLSLFIFYSFLKYQFNNFIDQQVNENHKIVQKTFQSNLKNDKEKLAFELDTMMSSLGLSKAVSEHNRTQLESIIRPYYTNLKKSYPDIKILTFRSSDGKTIYRAHKPEFYGDKVNGQRKLIKDTEKFKKSFSGFEVGKFGMTYRVTYPILYKDIYVGNVEVGLSPAFFLNNLKGIFNMYIGVSIHQSLLEIMLDHKRIPVDDSYVLINSDQVLQSYFLDDKVKSSKFLFSHNKLNIKNDIPLLNQDGQIAGYLVVGMDREKLVQKDNVFIYRLFGLIFIMMLGAGFVLYYGFKNILEFYTEQIKVDQLTGLKNRTALNELLVLNKKHVLILSDIKDFSVLNELYGVQIGNEVLKHIAAAFSDFGIKYGFKVFRIASDEYILYKEEEFFDADEYVDILESLHKSINCLEISIDGVFDTIKVDINSGIVFDHIASLEKAQMALKKTKRTTSPYMAYSKNVDTKEESETILQIKSSIRKGLEDQRIIPFFQPITDSKGNISKYEALIRIIEFKDGIKRIISPDSFIPVSKQNGFYTEISKRMIETSLLFFINKAEKISINLSPGDLFNAEIMDTLIENIKKFDTPSKIVIEITEQDNVENFERFVHGINILRRLGVLIAIDDFGSGYANFAHILVIKPDYLKIDGTLVSKIITNSDTKILVKSIVSFAKELKIKTIAEYVENEEIFELLKAYGVDEFQGYYFGKPIDLINQQDL